MFGKLIQGFKDFLEPSGSGLPFHLQPKRYRVRYLDGLVSVPMAKDVAEDYKNMFGGKLEKVDCR